MERFQSEQSRELFSKVVRFTRYALQFSPDEITRLATEQQASSPENSPQTTDRTIGNFIQESLGLENEVDASEGQLFFEDALADIGRIIKLIAKTHPELDDEAITETMSNPKTIDTIALLALRLAEDMLPYIRNELPDTGHLSPEKAYTINDSELSVDSIGCPAAGYTTTDSYDGYVKPLPIFKEFIPWATRVQLASNEWRDFREKTATNLEN